jgi:FkbM family methyltransferase
MTGATGNIYTGLHEFEDMALTLHLLREGDLFIDVGANVGSYTVLAGAVAGAKVIAVEPIPDTFTSLLTNLRLNNLDGLVTPLNVGLGDRKGRIRFTADLDCVNRALAPNEAYDGRSIDVEILPLDTLTAARDPALIKIDVEGFEGEVLAGADNTLRKSSLLAVIMEVSASPLQFGADTPAAHRTMLGFGFVPSRYDPFRRTLSEAPGVNHDQNNTLYVRNVPVVAERLRSAPSRRVFGIDL